jgi:hypothetical protein
MAISARATERIAREADAYLAQAGRYDDPSLDQAVRTLHAWPVYGDLGGVLLVAPDGEVYCRRHETLDLVVETDSRWRTIAWAAAAEQAPEVRELLPIRPDGTPDCSTCEGKGRIQATPTCRLWCGVCGALAGIGQGKSDRAQQLPTRSLRGDYRINGPVTETAKEVTALNKYGPCDE